MHAKTGGVPVGRSPPDAACVNKERYLPRRVGRDSEWGDKICSHAHQHEVRENSA